MGTRADFYIRKTEPEPSMEWLGSIAWDGYPDGIDVEVLKSTTEDEFRTCLNAFLEKESATLPINGWPWSWNDSRTTGFSYIFENGKVMASSFGGALFDPLLPESDDDSEDELSSDQDLIGYFPDMSNIKNVQLGGPRSGLIVVGIRKDNI